MEVLKKILENTCLNCGKRDPELRATACCIGVMICSDCAKGACGLCNEMHLFSSSHAKCLLVQVEGENIQYLIYESGVQIGRDASNGIRKWIVAWIRAPEQVC